MNGIVRLLVMPLLACVVAVGLTASGAWAATPTAARAATPGGTRAAAPTAPTPADTPPPTPITLGMGTPLPKWTSPEARLLDHTWWNQPDVIQALELRESQRTRMDELMKQALELQRAAQQKQREGRIAFDEAVRNGDWDAARKATNTLREATADQMGGQDELKLLVLPLLDEAQRQKLTTQYSYLVRRPWIVGVPMAGGIRMRGGSTPQPQP